VLELQQMDRMTLCSRPTAHDPEDDAVVTSPRRLIDVIVTSERTRYQRNLADVQYHSLSDVVSDVSAGQQQVGLCSQRIFLLKRLRDQGLNYRQLDIVFQAIVVSRILYALPG